MWTARSAPAAVIDGKLWIAGGNGGRVNSWNWSDGSIWTKVADKDNETSRGEIESWVMGNRLYLIGGYRNNTCKDYLLKYGP